MNKYWLFEMDVFVEGEIEGVGIRHVVEYNSDLPPLHEAYRFITKDCPVKIEISFKLVQQIDKECFDFFSTTIQEEQAIE